MKQYSGLDWIKIDIANQFGINGTFLAQIKWVNKQHKLQERVLEAKHPARYMAACIALEDTKIGHPTGHLVGLDASASGAQMMAALISCKTTARNTGIIGKRKSDLYSLTTLEMGKILGNKVILDRDKIKSAVMTRFYGSKAIPVKLFGKGTPELRAFYQALQNIAPGAADLMHIFMQAWQPYAEEHSWVMPDGFQVRVPVIQKAQEMIHIPDLDTEVLLQSSVIEGELKGISLPAHITHSVDSYVMREVIKRCPFELLCTHDEYLAHPNNMNEVRQAYVDVLAEIADGNLLDSILSQITGETVHIEKYDTGLGTLIRQAEYAIS